MFSAGKVNLNLSGFPNALFFVIPERLDFNPGLLPQDNPLRREIFENMASTSGLFLALEPQVFVSKIRCRVFCNWKAAEDYYSNTLREAKYTLVGEKEPEPEVEDSED